MSQSELVSNVENAANVNVIKTRDDQQPIHLVSEESSDDGSPTFKLRRSSAASWAQPEGTIRTSHLRERIEPWLTALLQSEHLSLLVGAGLSFGVSNLATGSVTPFPGISFSQYDEEIRSAALKAARAADRQYGNPEDVIRVANELLRGLEVLGEKDQMHQAAAATLRNELTQGINKFATAILKTESSISDASTDARERAFTYLIRFLMTFASRSGTRERLHLFTTNYDRVIETGSDFAGLRLIDRFLGSITPIFRSSRLEIDMHYNPPGMRGEPRYLEGVARYTKLHGSLDWVDIRGNIQRVGLPFGTDNLDPYLNANGLSDADAFRLMIYPNAAKDRETAFYPYVELFRDFAAAVCRPNSTLVCFGYSFGDEHINRVIDDMLTIPSTHLVIISRDDPLSRVSDFAHHDQVSLLLGNHLGDFQSLVDNFLPKPAIDRTTRRMAELLRARITTSDGDFRPVGTESTQATDDVIRGSSE